MTNWDIYELDIGEAIEFIKAYEEDLENAEALAKEMRGELDKLTQELHDSKYLAARREKSLNAWKAKAKQWRESGNAYFAYFEAYKEANTDRFELGTQCALAEALAAKQEKLLRVVLLELKRFEHVVDRILIEEIESELAKELSDE